MTIINENNNSHNGIGFFGLLQITFIVLKLFDIIKWSWWLVFIPLYVWVFLFIVIVAAAVIFN